MKLKRLFLVLIFAVSALITNSQVYNNGHLVGSKNKVRLLVAPAVYYSNGVNDLLLFFNGGLSLTNGLDLGADIGVNDGANYYGAYLEWAIANYFSLTAGAHQWGNFGVDGALNASIPIGSAYINIGLDSDLTFPTNNTARFDLYLPIGFEASLSSVMAFYFESGIGLNINRIIFNGGLAFHF